MIRRVIGISEQTQYHDLHREETTSQRQEKREWTDFLGLVA
jgi:hypothetical protein